ncbi:hypothetical protein ACJW31_12G100700 [Castanea mollissima]
MAPKSKTRRSRVGLNRDNHRPSKSRPSHFFKIILPSTMRDLKLSIPPKFVKDFGDEISTLATLSVSCGGTWKVGLLKAEKNIWFCDGLEDFFEYHSISAGHLLVFRYEGHSNFHVIIFDKTATETQYPSSKNVILEEPEDVVELDESEMSRQDMQPPNTSSKGRERAFQAAKMSMPKSAFLTVLQPYNIRFKYVYVPKGFANKHVAWNQFVNLQTSGKKQWRVRCYSHTSTSSAMRLGMGWAAFSRDNYLEEGDVCVFEVIKTSPTILMRVSIFRVQDYAVN